MPESQVNLNEVFQNLVASIEAHNRMVRKLNKSKCYQRADHNYIKEVSNDEVEVNPPDISSFMHIANNNPENQPLTPMEPEPIQQPFPTSGIEGGIIY